MEAGAIITVADVSETETRATVVLRDSDTREADLVLAADGIKSRIRRRIIRDTGADIDPKLS